MSRAIAVLGRGLGLLLIGPILVYRYCLSPMLGPRCRFAPSCSEYAMEAIRVHGPIVGAGLALRRIVRCHPLGGSGYDPVPVPRGGGRCSDVGPSTRVLAAGAAEAPSIEQKV